ncbi:MAG: hypothetical protein QXP60_02635 [Nitrososphaerota archaeon]
MKNKRFELLKKIRMIKEAYNGNIQRRSPAMPGVYEKIDGNKFMRYHYDPITKVVSTIEEGVIENRGGKEYYNITKSYTPPYGYKVLTNTTDVPNVQVTYFNSRGLPSHTVKYDPQQHRREIVTAPSQMTLKAELNRNINERGGKITSEYYDKLIGGGLGIFSNHLIREKHPTFIEMNEFVSGSVSRSFDAALNKEKKLAESEGRNINVDSIKNALVNELETNLNKKLGDKLNGLSDSQKEAYKKLISEYVSSYVDLKMTGKDVNINNLNEQAVKVKALENTLVTFSSYLKSKDSGHLEMGLAHKVITKSVENLQKEIPIKSKYFEKQVAELYLTSKDAAEFKEKLKEFVEEKKNLVERLKFRAVQNGVDRVFKIMKARARYASRGSKLLFSPLEISLMNGLQRTYPQIDIETEAGRKFFNDVKSGIEKVLGDSIENLETKLGKEYWGGISGGGYGKLYSQNPIEEFFSTQLGQALMSLFNQLTGGGQQQDKQKETTSPKAATTEKK